MASEELVVHGAREHNLKDVTVRLPRNKLICITGLSGSGKSSLAGDLDRPEDDLAQPALDGRDGHGDLRLPATSLRARRPSALPGLRPSHLRSEPGVDRR